MLLPLFVPHLRGWAGEGLRGYMMFNYYGMTIDEL